MCSIMEAFPTNKMRWALIYKGRFIEQMVSRYLPDKYFDVYHGMIRDRIRHT